jgi:hypothetical protein
MRGSGEKSTFYVYKRVPTPIEVLHINSDLPD